MFLTGLHVFVRKMTTLTEALLSPVGVRGMKVLERTKFLRNIRVPLLKVTEECLSKVTKHCKPYFLKLENFKPVRDFEDVTFKKCIYLNPEKISQWTDIDDSIRKVLQEHGLDENNFDTKEVQLSYDNFRFDTIFKAVLPENKEIVSGFSQVGHIIHLNLRDHLIEYKQLIGEVLLDKVKNCSTVVNKSHIIDNEYRNFNMEVIAGKEDFFVTVKENDCIFQFDFSKVYWNSRLGMEHERVLSYLSEGDVLFDVFCGVGPFAIPAAKRKCNVFANDLNPESFKWLNHNAKKNKINTTLFKSYNLDGKDFICTVFKDYIIENCQNAVKTSTKIHITMNLPATAVEFLKYFKGLINIKELEKQFKNEIIVYVYCFALGQDPITVAKMMVTDHMGCDMNRYIIDVFDVRNVSPNKEMMRVTFKLTKEVLFGVKLDSESVVEPPIKKVCIENENKH